MEITELLKFAVRNKASDLHLSAGMPPLIRVHGNVRRLNVDPLPDAKVHEMVHSVMNDAQKKAAFVDGKRHLVLKAPHPSPLSAHNGFFGCRHFSRANEFLVSRGLDPIDWRLPDVPLRSYPEAVADPAYTP